MTRCKRMLERKYSGSLYKYWTDVSVQELIDAGVKVYWHVNWYGVIRWEAAEDTKWRLARSEAEMDKYDFAMKEWEGRYLEGRVMIYFNIKDEATWKEVQAIEKRNEQEEKEYWREFRESGRADQCAIERGWALMGADPEWYEKQTAPEKVLA